MCVDGWDDAFEQSFRAWPDKCLLLDAHMRLLAMSSYGARADALVDYDCVDLLEDLVQGRHLRVGVGVEGKEVMEEE